MLSFRKKTTIEHTKIDLLKSGAEQYLSVNYHDVKYKMDDAESQDHPDLFNIPRYSLDNERPFNVSAFDSSMRNFITGNSNETTETFFKQQVSTSFSGAVIKYIEQKNLKDSEVYKAAGIDRRLFSKIVSNNEYKPSKNTCIAIALALKLNLEDTKDLMSRAGFTLSHSIKRDLVIEYCIREKEYSLIYVNELLHRFGMATLNET